MSERHRLPTIIAEARAGADDPVVDNGVVHIIDGVLLSPSLIG